MDLIKKMLKVNPDERITAEEAISHPYFKDE
jgi:serine/threonine protein kinase